MQSGFTPTDRCLVSETCARILHSPTRVPSPHTRAIQAVGSVYNGDVSAVTRKLQERNIYFVAGREAPGQQASVVSCLPCSRRPAAARAAFCLPLPWRHLQTASARDLNEFPPPPGGAQCLYPPLSFSRPRVTRPPRACIAVAPPPPPMREPLAIFLSYLAAFLLSITLIIPPPGSFPPPPRPLPSAPAYQIVYYSFKLVQVQTLAEVTFPAAGQPRLCIRSEAPPYAPLALQLLEVALRQ